MIKKFISQIAMVIIFTQSTAFATQGPTVEQFKSEYANYQRYSDQKQWSESLAHAKNAYEMGRSLFGESSKNTAALAYNYGLNLLELKNYEDAEKALQETLELYEVAYGNESKELIPVLMDLGDSMTEFKSGTRRTRIYDRAIEISKNIYGHDSVSVGEKYVRAGEVLLLRAQSIEAKEYLYTGHKILEKKLGEKDARVGYAALNIGKFELSIRDYDEAVIYFKKALISFSVPDQPSNRYELSTHGFLVQTYEKMEKRDLATEHCLAIGRMTPATNAQDYQPLVKISPNYPITALQQGQEGYVIVEYEVDEMGYVVNPRVIDRDGPKAFVSASIDAAKKFRYAPAFVDGKPVITNGVQNKFHYRISNKPK